ncbi:hypothetical protein FACS1894216_19770 [Synergistales bacterium]|nr:hypothetical protein FACS1894216_19770 [Synergistales bacterium]
MLTPTPVIERIKPRQISIFASEEEQIGSIQAQALTYDDIGFALALGSGATGGKERIARICAEYAKTKDIADALKQEYGTGGRSLIYPDGVKGWLSYDWKKLTLSKGENEFVSLSWIQAANRITNLVLSGEYGAEFMPLSVFTINEPSETIEATQEEVNDTPELVSVEPEITEPFVEIPKLDYRIPDEPRDYGGSKTRYRNNVEAIKTLKAIEAEERAATAEEQKVLSLYIGWGGLPQAFDRNNDKWANEYTELQGLFTDEEYRSAMASTLNAH